VVTRVAHTERKREHAGGWVYWVRGDGDVLLCDVPLLFRGFRDDSDVYRKWNPRLMGQMHDVEQPNENRTLVSIGLKENTNNGGQRQTNNSLWEHKK
jgi:hypothetical protein